MNWVKWDGGIIKEVSKNGYSWFLVILYKIGNNSDVDGDGDGDGDGGGDGDDDGDVDSVSYGDGGSDRIIST